MKRQKKIWLPYDKSEIGAITTWLEEQAEQGWQLIRTDSHTMTFEESIAEALRYLIAPHTAEISCLNLGWQRIDLLSKNFDIYATEDSAVEEPNLIASDVQIALYQEVMNHTYIGIPCFILAVLTVLRFWIYISTLGGVISAFVKFGMLLFLSLAVATISGFICGIWHFRQAKIRSEHLSELAAHQRTPMFSWHPKRFTGLIYLLVFCSIFSVWQMHHVTVQKFRQIVLLAASHYPFCPLTQKRHFPC